MGDLVWQLIRGHNAFAVNRRQGDGGAKFSTERGNIDNRHTRSSSGLANADSVSVEVIKKTLTGSAKLRLGLPRRAGTPHFTSRPSSQRAYQIVNGTPGRQTELLRRLLFEKGVHRNFRPRLLTRVARLVRSVNKPHIKISTRKKASLKRSVRLFKKRKFQAKPHYIRAKRAAKKASKVSTQ